ncbi:MAG: hypothetical protein ACE5ER_01610 [Nitrospinaceae bacterium]
MSQQNDPERDFERLSKAITEAVMASPKVRKIVSEIQKKDKVCGQSFMVLVLRLSTLTQAIEGEVPMELSPEKPKKKPARRGRKKISDTRQFIDGQKLSKKEIEFQEFANKRFDPVEWLKQNKLIF